MGSMMMPMMMMGAIGMSCMVAVGGGALYMISTGAFPGTAAGNLQTTGNTTTTGGLVINPDGSISQQAPAGPPVPSYGKLLSSEYYDVGEGLYRFRDVNKNRYIHARDGGSKGKCDYEEDVWDVDTVGTKGQETFYLQKVNDEAAKKDNKQFYYLRNQWRGSSCATGHKDTHLALANYTCTVGAKENRNFYFQNLGSDFNNYSKQFGLKKDPKSNNILLESRHCAHNQKEAKYLTVTGINKQRQLLTDINQASRFALEPA